MLILVDELREEIKLLEEEQSKLISSRFDKIKDSKYDEELQELQDKIHKMELDIKSHLSDKSNLTETIKKLNGNFVQNNLTFRGIKGSHE